MSLEAELWAALVAHAPLTAVVPPERVSIDSVESDTARPYIAFSKQSETKERGLDGTVHHHTMRMDLQCVGVNRSECIQVAELVREALDAAGQPADDGTAGFDPENEIEAEVVTVEWWA